MQICRDLTAAEERILSQHSVDLGHQFQRLCIHANRRRAEGRPADVQQFVLPSQARTVQSGLIIALHSEGLIPFHACKHMLPGNGFSPCNKKSFCIAGFPSLEWSSFIRPRCLRPSLPCRKKRGSGSQLLDASLLPHASLLGVSVQKPAGKRWILSLAANSCAVLSQCSASSATVALNLS
jgi:hypothetical protein